MSVFWLLRARFGPGAAIKSLPCRQSLVNMTRKLEIWRLMYDVGQIRRIKLWQLQLIIRKMPR
jgi:hypothetical protein